MSMTDPTAEPDPLSMSERARRANTVERDKKRRKKKTPGKKRREDPKLSAWNAKLSLRLGAKELNFLCFQLRALVEAGFPLSEAWRHAALSSNHPVLRPICKKISVDLAEGIPFEKALARHEGRLSPFACKMMTAAHRSGNLGPALGDLQRHFSWLMHIKGDVIRGFSYLIICLFLVRLILVITAFFITGVMEAQAEGETVGLPDEPIRLFLSLTWRAYWPVFLTIAIAYGMSVVTMQVKRLRFIVDVIFVSIPVIRGFVRTAVVSNFCRMYGKLQSAGMMPSEVYRLAADSMGNLAMRKQMLAWQHFVDHGEPIAEALKRSKVLPKDTVALLEISDSVASSDRLMEHIANFTSENLRVQVRTFTRVISAFAPFLLLVVVVIAMGAARAGSVDLGVGFDLYLFFLIFYVIFLL